MNTSWLKTAISLIGVKETKGSITNPEIAKWLKDLGAWWQDDETPWCGLFVAYCIKSAGIPYPKNWMRAKAWQEFGIPLAEPVVGAVVVFTRDGGGHVGFVVGKAPNGNLMVLGGNQGDMVKISEFKLDRVLGYYWPENIPVPTEPLPIIKSDGKLSINEA